MGGGGLYFNRTLICEVALRGENEQEVNNMPLSTSNLLQRKFRRNRLVF
jgi:hypothetical protein